MPKKNESPTNLQDWAKVIVGLALALAATAEVGRTASDPTQQPATCVTLRT